MKKVLNLDDNIPFELKYSRYVTCKNYTRRVDQYKNHLLHYKDKNQHQTKHPELWVTIGQVILFVVNPQSISGYKITKPLLRSVSFCIRLELPLPFIFWRIMRCNDFIHAIFPEVHLPVATLTLSRTQRPSLNHLFI